MDVKRQRREAYALREAMLAMNPPVVVVAEDDADIRRLVVMALRMEGYSVVEALDGAHLAEHIDSALLFGNLHGGLDPIALVISDVRMSGKTGIEVLARLRKEELRVAVVLMTAHPDPSVREEAERLGADGFLPKPFEIDDLLAIVNGILSAKRAPSRSATHGQARAAATPDGQDRAGARRVSQSRHM